MIKMLRVKLEGNSLCRQLEDSSSLCFNHNSQATRTFTDKSFPDSRSKLFQVKVFKLNQTLNKRTFKFQLRELHVSFSQTIAYPPSN